jgi:spermidine synthase
MLLVKLSRALTKRETGSSLRTLVRKEDPNEFMNKYTRWFFKQIDLGFGSPWIATLGVMCASWSLYVFCRAYIVPTVNERIAKVPALRMPLADSHNIFWGLHTTTGLSRDIATQEYASPEEIFRRPSLIHSETSETFPEYDIAVLDMGEYDPSFKDDVHYRSVHYVPKAPDEKSLQALADQKANKWAKDSDVPTLKTTNAPIEEPIHAIVKCRSISDTNNCSQFAGSVEDEMGRKLLLTLGPYAIARDPTFHVTHHHRITEVYQDPANALILGLRGGSLGRFLTAAATEFSVDYIEEDSAMLRCARRFLGHRDTAAVKTNALSPLEYLQHVSSGRIEKKYNIILVDCIGPDGTLKRDYCKLETITNLRESLTPTGVVAVVIPNSNLRFLRSAVDNYRLGFPNSSAMMVHGETVPQSVLILAREEGQLYVSQVRELSLEDLKSVLNSYSQNSGNQRIRVDLGREISERNYLILPPEKHVETEELAPWNHPAVLAKKQAAINYGIESSLKGAKPDSWLGNFAGKMRKWSGSNLTPSMEADYGIKNNK